MSYESTKVSTNSSGGDTMTSEMPSQSSGNSFYPNTNNNNNNNNNNTNRTQAMIMNPMMAGVNYYNGPPQGTPSQQMPNRPMYQSYTSAPPPHHQIVSIFLIISFFMNKSHDHNESFL
jgi:hypothetical protein